MTSCAGRDGPEEVGDAQPVAAAWRGKWNDSPRRRGAVVEHEHGVALRGAAPVAEDRLRLQDLAPAEVGEDLEVLGRISRSRNASYSAGVIFFWRSPTGTGTARLVQVGHDRLERDRVDHRAPKNGGAGHRDVAADRAHAGRASPSRTQAGAPRLDRRLAAGRAAFLRGRRRLRGPSRLGRGCPPSAPGRRTRPARRRRGPP